MSAGGIFRNYHNNHVRDRMGKMTIVISGRIQVGYDFIFVMTEAPAMTAAVAIPVAGWQQQNQHQKQQQQKQ